MTIQDIPARELVKLASFRTADDVYTKNIVEQKSLPDTARDLHRNYSPDSMETPRIYYILHEADDGELAAKALEGALRQAGDEPLLNPRLDLAHPESFIKRGALCRKAKEKGYWQPQPLFDKDAPWRVMSFFITLLLTVLCSGSFFTLLESSRPVAIGLGVLAVLLVPTALVLLARQIGAARARSLALLGEHLQTLDEREYDAFLACFTAQEMQIPSLKPSPSGKSVAICSLSRYYSRQSRVLLRYLATLPENQVWFVFAPVRTVGAQSVIPNSEALHTEVRYLCPLPLEDKRRLDALMGRSTPRQTLRKLGVDRICSALLERPADEAERIALADRIALFEKNYRADFTCNIRTVIRLIADLHLHYAVDFGRQHAWEYLFDYPAEPSAIDRADRELAKKECFNGRPDVGDADLKQLKNLANFILVEFGDDLHTLLANRLIEGQTGDYRQLCLLKALRVRANAEKQGTRLRAVAEAIMEEIPADCSWLPDLRTEAWTAILQGALGALAAHGEYDFLPELLHCLLSVWEGVPAEKCPTGLFSAPAVLGAARLCLLLCPNRTEPDAEGELDILRDHYTLTVAAASERGEALLTSGVQPPAAFDLFDLDGEARARYYKALVALGEQSVLDFYNRIYDIFCAAAHSGQQNIRYFSRHIAANDLSARYGRTLPAPSADESYIKGALLALTRTLRAEADATLAADLDTLAEALACDGLSPEQSERLLLLLLKFEVRGLATVGFLLCLLLRMQPDHNLSRQLYLGFGSSLIRLVFLVYHEKDGFTNDDFVYLVRLLTGRKNATESQLALLLACGIFVMPKSCRASIIAYLATHHDEVLPNLLSVTRGLAADDIEGFISFFETAPYLAEEEKHRFYGILRDRLSTELQGREDSPVLCELLTLILDRQSSKAFAEMEDEAIGALLAKRQPDTVYFCLNYYAEIDHRRFLALCPMLAEVMMRSKITLVPSLLMQYTEESEQRQSEGYLSAMRLLYRHLCDKRQSTKRLSEKIAVLDRFGRFLSTLYGGVQESPALYDWYDGEEGRLLLSRILLDRADILQIESRALFKEKIWQHYGILFYLKHLMTEGLVARRTPADYEALSREERLTYIRENYRTIAPLLQEQEGKRPFFNTAYIDMLDAYIANEQELQSLEREEKALLRFGKDAHAVAGYVFAGTPQQAQALQMIEEYLGRLGDA